MTSSAATTATFCATLVDQWLSCGVRHAVISPGSRSTPMALALAKRNELELHVFHDERSAAFAALGIAKASGVPAILLCTSGTAAVEFHAAVVEAHHAEIPILVCTADRPPELQNVGAPQTIDQTNLYGVAVRLFHNAAVADDLEQNNWRKLARTLFAASLGVVPGPVHLNLQFREPLVGEPNDLPLQTADSDEVIANKVNQISGRRLKKILDYVAGKNGVIIAGTDSYDPQIVLSLGAALGWPVFADPRSGARLPESKVVIAAMDSILRNQQFAESHQPEVILRLGAPLVSKVVNAWLASCQVPQVVLTTTPTLIDPERITSMHLSGDVGEICNLIIDYSPNAVAGSWLGIWSDAEDKAQRAINETLSNEQFLSEPVVARAIYGLLPEGSNLFVSSSMPIRDLEWFAAPRTGLKVLANRGVNGIDGVVSTAIGVALATKATTALLIGDIALLHDTNGLLNLGNRKIDLRIIVLDNRGGGIFSFLPQASALSTDTFEKVFGTPHDVDIEMLAKSHRIESETVENLDQLTEAIVQRGPYLIRVVTDRNENVRVHDRINQTVSLKL